MKTSEYSLKTKTGKHIRIATKVTFADGYEVKFIEKMPNGAAIKQAQELRPILERGWPYPTEAA